MTGARFLSFCMAAWAMLTAACSLTTRPQRYQDFQTTAVLSESETLIIGFIGGREDWDSEKEGVRRLALDLRSRNIPNVHVETVENKQRSLALQLIQNVFDRDRNGSLDVSELQSVRIILYGQSFGGAAVVKAAGELKKKDIPILLTVQIDSVGRNDAVIPDNVKAAANLFQRNGKVIRGEPVIRAEEPSKTRILGNFEFDYRKKNIDLSHVSFWKKLFRTDHTKMNFDPDVWKKVEELILEALSSFGNTPAEGGPP